jgi:hypothetical protein
MYYYVFFSTPLLFIAPIFILSHIILVNNIGNAIILDFLLCTFIYYIGSKSYYMQTIYN